MHEQERCFVNPNDNEYQYDEDQNTDRMADLEQDDLEDTNTNVPFNMYISAESEILVPSAKMLQTIKQVAQELLATSVLPFKREISNINYSGIQLKAREKLQSLGLNEFQISRLIEFQIKRLSPRKKKQEGSKNLVYQATRRKRKAHKNNPRHHHQKLN